MKKIFTLLLIFTSVLLFACVNNEDKKVENEEGEIASNKIRIVTTIFPEYDWVRNLIKGNEDKFDLSILMTSGVDLHNFQPSAKDILDIGLADLFIYIGGESDKWVDGALRQVVNKDIIAINLMGILENKVKVEELKEGMEDDEHHHDEENGEDYHEEELEYDEHVWLSLENAMIVCSYLSNVITSLDEENASLYKNNLSQYLNELSSLNEEYKSVVNNSERRLMLFGDRFPFRYMFDDFGLNYYAAFKGCSAETEASFKTIKFLADKLGEENLPYVMKIERSDDKIARAVIDNSSKKDAKIETMYSIQAVNSEDLKNGETYITYMKKNLEVLKKVLN